MSKRKLALEIRVVVAWTFNLCIIYFIYKPRQIHYSIDEVEKSINLLQILFTGFLGAIYLIRQTRYCTQIMLEVILVRYFVTTCLCKTLFIQWIVHTKTVNYIQGHTTDLFTEISFPPAADAMLARKPMANKSTDVNLKLKLGNSFGLSCACTEPRCK